MDRYDTAKAWRAAWMTQIAPQIATHLLRLEPRKGWELKISEHEYDNPHFTALDNEDIYLAVDDYKRRVTVGGIYGRLPNGYTWIPRDGGVTCPAPTLSADKDPAIIARDILHRFIRDYRACLSIYRERCQEMQARRDEVAELADQLVRVGRDVLSPQTDVYQRDTGTRTIHFRQDVAGVSYGSLAVSSNYVRAELTMDGETAQRFVRMLQRAVLDGESK